MKTMQMHTVQGIHCTSVWSKIKGLMFSKPKVLIFHFAKPTRVSLHMWFVFFPIDLIFLDSKQRVIEIKKNFKPWRFYSSKQEAFFVIEVPTGYAATMHIGLQDTIIFK